MLPIWCQGREISPAKPGWTAQLRAAGARQHQHDHPQQHRQSFMCVCIPRIHRRRPPPRPADERAARRPRRAKQREDRIHKSDPWDHVPGRDLLAGFPNLPRGAAMAAGGSASKCQTPRERRSRPIGHLKPNPGHQGRPPRGTSRFPARKSFYVFSVCESGHNMLTL